MGEPRFSVQTSLELINSLNAEQVDRELVNCNPNGLLIILEEPLDDRKLKLKDLYMTEVFKQHDNMQSTIDELTKSLSRYTETIGASMENFTKKFEAAQTLLSRVQQQPPQPPIPSTLLTSTQEVTEPGNGNIVEPFTDLGDIFTDLDIARLVNDTDFATSFASRSVGYYGEYPYKYAGGFHQARPMADNPYLLEIARRVQEAVPGASFNSAAITKYEHRSSHIPPHQDNESQILPGSSIICVSLGATRDVVFRSLPRALLDKLTLNVRHGAFIP